MTRLLFDARPLAEARGGVSRVTKRILDHLRETQTDTEITLVTTGASRPTLDPSFQHLHLPLPNKMWSALSSLGLTSLDQAAGSFDELILPNIGFVGQPKIPYTIVVHDLSFLIEPKWFPWKMRVWHRAVRAERLIRNATNVWCVSETTAKDAERLLGVEKQRITILPRDVVVGARFIAPRESPRGLMNQAPTPARAPYVLAFNGAPRKNISTAIAAITRLREDEKFRDLQLIVVGHLPYPVPDWVVMRPEVSDDELDDLYRNASALLYPSWYEGFGLPLYEAARFNLPCLASAHGALPETAPQGTILIPPAKPHLWVKILKDIVKI